MDTASDPVHGAETPVSGQLAEANRRASSAPIPPPQPPPELSPLPIPERNTAEARPASPAPNTAPPGLAPEAEGESRPARTGFAAASTPASEPAADRVYTVTEVDDPPRAVARVQASYTESTARARVQGVVLLECEVWPDGRAHRIEVVKSIGYPDLDRNAAQALEKWRFVPARKDQVAVKVRLRIEHAFTPPPVRGAPTLTKDN
jgi:protein TonB